LETHVFQDVVSSWGLCCQYLDLGSRSLISKWFYFGI